MIFINGITFFSIISSRIPKSYVSCGNVCRVLEDNGLQWFYDVGIVFKHTHLKYGVFLRNIVFFPTLIQ